jgi:arsenate reductase (thioredoxin)
MDTMNPPSLDRRCEMADELDEALDRRRQRTVDELAEDFEGVWSRETIERFLTESEEDLARLGPGGLNFMPLRAGTFARERLEALAQAEGEIEKEKPEVLFVCVRNAGRSQVAAALTHELSDGSVSVRSAGSAPAEEIHPNVVKALDEIGVDIAKEFPKPLTDEVVRAADVVVTMGCGDACPVYPGKHYEDWEIADPAGESIDGVRRIRDEIRGRVENLIAELTVPGASA